MSFLSNISHGLATFLLAMLPMGELRASIPVGLLVFHLPLWQVFILSVLGNMVPAILIVYLLGPISDILRKIKVMDRFFSWLFAHTRKRFDGHYASWGNIALMVFVAIPLPVTGAWTGAAAAWLFGIKKTPAIFFIFCGVLLAGVIVSLVSLGALSLFNFAINLNYNL